MREVSCSGFITTGMNCGGRAPPPPPPPLVLLLLSLDGRESKAAGDTWWTSIRWCLASSLLLSTFLHRPQGTSEVLAFVGVEVWVTGERQGLVNVSVFARENQCWLWFFTLV